MEQLKFTRPWPLSLPIEPRLGNGNGATPKTRILVAEDDAVSRELICSDLEKWGYDVIATEDGIETMMALQSALLGRVKELENAGHEAWASPA